MTSFSAIYLLIFRYACWLSWEELYDEKYMMEKINEDRYGLESKKQYIKYEKHTAFLNKLIKLRIYIFKHWVLLFYYLVKLEKKI